MTGQRIFWQLVQVDHVLQRIAINDLSPCIEILCVLEFTDLQYLKVINKLLFTETYFRPKILEERFFQLFSFFNPVFW